MKFFTFVIFLSTILFGGLFVSVSAVESPTTTPTVPPKPNIVMFIADDASFFDFGCWGSPNAKTPNIDRLAQEGVRFTKFYSPASVCSPLRQALLTGMFPIRNGAYPNHAKVYPDVKSLPTHLKQLGYRTACVGKTHFAPAANFPFDMMTGAIDPETSPNVKTLETFLTTATESQQPFCVYIASNEPHSPWTKGDRSAIDPQKLVLPPYMVDTPETRHSLQGYYAEIAVLDNQVGLVLDMLDKTGHRDDTIVFFFSEQGNSLPHSKWTLYDAGIRTATITRWPGVIKPGSECSALVQYVDILPTLIDIAGGKATDCKTGRPDTNGYEGFDGISFADVLSGKKTTLRDFAYSQHTANGISNGPPAYATRSVTDGEWKLIYNVHFDKKFQNVETNSVVYRSWVAEGEKGNAFAKEQAERYVQRPEWELYHLTTDPWELENVANKPANRAIRAKLKLALETWMRQQGDKGDETERKAREHQARGNAGESSE